jgi:hypothetical protein
MTIKWTVTAFSVTTNESNVWEISNSYKWGDPANVAWPLASSTVTPVAIENNNWSVTVGAELHNDLNSNYAFIGMHVIGEAGKNIQWIATGEFVEMFSADSILATIN